MDRMEESFQLSLVELSIGSDPRTKIETEGGDFADRLLHVVRIQSSGQEQRDGDALANSPAESPIVHASGAAEFFYSQRRISRVEQYGIDLRRDGDGLIEGFGSANMNHLNDRDAG